MKLEKTESTIINPTNPSAQEEKSTIKTEKSAVTERTSDKAKSKSEPNKTESIKRENDKSDIKDKSRLVLCNCFFVCFFLVGVGVDSFRHKACNKYEKKIN